MNTRNNNPNKSYTIAKAIHKSSGDSLLSSCSFDKSENKQTYYRGRDCMKRFCDDLNEHITRIASFEMKPMDPLTQKKKNHMKIKSYVIYARKNFVPIIITMNIKK